MSDATETKTPDLAPAPRASRQPVDEAPPPYVPPPPEGPQRRILALRLRDPLHWLAMGWRDLTGHMGIGIFYWFCFWAMAVTLAAVFRSRPEYVMSIASGCLLLGPFLAMGLYEVSRRRELGLVPELGGSLTCWDTHIRSIGMLVLVLVVLELLWGRASLVVFAVFFNTGMPSTTGVIAAIFNPENWDFVALYLAVGFLFAGLVYATTVVSIPMILDRDTDAITAAITSMQVVYENTVVMLFWGLLISTLVAVALLPWGLGLLLVGPWLGHASWHAYRGSVQWLPDADAAQPRS